MSEERAPLGAPLSAWGVVDLDAVRDNIGAIRERVGGAVSMLLSVKADAYGLGAVPVALAAVRAGAGMLGVATLEEGIELREAGVDAPILILSPSLPEGAGLIVRHRLRATAGSLDLARELGRVAREAGTAAVVHVEVDTGMGRAGVHCDEAPRFIHELSQIAGLTLEGLFTHFPVSNDNDVAFTRGQCERFARLCDELAAAGLHIPLRHAANSAALVNAPFSYFNMVRPGLLAYGFQPAVDPPAPLRVRPAMELRSRVLEVRDVRVGEGVSYGRTFVATRPMRVAVVGIGYGHGYSRLLSNRGAVLVRGARAPILGRVTMDMTMADVTGIPGVEAGDEVVLFGRQGGAQITVDEVAGWQETINYEVICHLGRRVARVYLEGGRPTRIRTMLGERNP